MYSNRWPSPCLQRVPTQCTDEGYCNTKDSQQEGAFQCGLRRRHLNEAVMSKAMARPLFHGHLRFGCVEIA